MSQRYHLADVPEELRLRIAIHPAWGCWEWQHDDGPSGGKYGSAKWLGVTYPAYRLFYMLLVGPIPPGMTIDHVYARGCRSKACCWPEHMELVTKAENTRRGCLANTVNGVSPSVQRRLLSGTASAGDLALADAVWMLPFPVTRYGSPS